VNNNVKGNGRDHVKEEDEEEDKRGIGERV
jgi:hypothetical protein